MSLQKPLYRRGVSVPVQADSVEPPVFTYNAPLTAMDFISEDEETWWRVTFENLDSIKISRGEYAPFLHDEYSWVSVVENSAWLKERYEYEKEHYENCYEWNGNVDEMLTEFDHYVFSFHDEFIEVIAKGIWFDLLDEWGEKRHPLANLSPTENTERRQAHGYTYQIRTNPTPVQKIIKDSELCSQILMQFAIELDDNVPSPTWTLTLRSRNGNIVSSLQEFFGSGTQIFSGVADLNQVLPHIEKWILEVKKRRRKRWWD